MGSQGIGPQTPQAFPYACASGTATPGRAIRLDLGCRGDACRFGAGLAGVAARSRSCLVPDPRPLRVPTQAFSGEEQGSGHRARFPRPGNAQRHEETLQQKGGSMAGLSSLGGAGGWQFGWLEKGASFAGYAATVSQFARFDLATLSWPLGPRLGFSVTRSFGTFLAQSCNLWGLGRPGHKGYGFRQASHTASSQRCGSGLGTLLEAVGEGNLPGFCGAAHGSDGEGLAGPQLLVNQMGTWLPLWLDPRRANAKQLADQEDMGEPLSRPSLEEVDNVCKTYKHTAGLGHDCINLKAILQLPDDLRVRFIDLLMMFEAKLVKPLNWSHMMVLSPSHLEVTAQSASRWLRCGSCRGFAGRWRSSGRTSTMRPISGTAKACDRAAWAHSIVVAAAKGRQQSAASLLLDLAKFYEHVGHDHLWEEGRKTRFPTRLLACWCASYEGWRFLEADKCATFPFWAFGTILPGCSGATMAAKLMLATLLETVATSLPTYRLWNVVDDISGHVADTPKIVQVLTAEAGRLLVEGLQARGWTRLPFCGLTALHTGISPRARFSGKPSGHSSFLASWTVGHSGIETFSSSWSHEASGRRKGLRGSGERGRRQLPVVQRWTRHHVPPLLRMPGLADRKRHVRLTGGAPGCTRGEFSTQGTVCTRHFFLTLAPFFQQVFLNASARFSGTIGPQMGYWRGTFSQTALRRAMVRCDVEAGRTSHLCKRSNDFADTFAKKRADTHKPAFRVAKTVVACSSLAKQAARWAAEAHVLLRFRWWNDTRAAAPRSRVRLPRARLKRKREKEIAAPVTGQVSDWLSPIFPSRFSQDSHLDPRTFRGHSLQLGRVFDAGSRALGNSIIFCAKCGAVYWERADALCRQSPGSRASQLRKLRSGLFPNKRYSGWFVVPPWTKPPLWWRS